MSDSGKGSNCHVYGPDVVRGTTCGSSSLGGISGSVYPGIPGGWIDGTGLLFQQSNSGEFWFHGSGSGGEIGIIGDGGDGGDGDGGDFCGGFSA